MLQSLLLEDIEDAAIGQYDRQCLAPTKITVTRMIPKHGIAKNLLNGLKPVHKQNLPLQLPKRLSQNHTTSFANGKPHPTFDCCVGDNSGWQWYHSSAQWLSYFHPSSAPPLFGFTSI